jgi:hypothetical protein
LKKGIFFSADLHPNLWGEEGLCSNCSFVVNCVGGDQSIFYKVFLLLQLLRSLCPARVSVTQQNCASLQGPILRSLFSAIFANIRQKMSDFIENQCYNHPFFLDKMPVIKSKWTISPIFSAKLFKKSRHRSKISRIFA